MASPTPFKALLGKELQQLYLVKRHHVPRPLANKSAAQPRHKRRRQLLVATAAQRGSRQTRLATRVNTLPRRVDLYFAGNFFRQAVWAVIAFSTGYYSANTVSLSFGALAINDVVAAAITVAFCEVCSQIYYSAPKVTLKLVLLNSFKMGVIAALIADAFKLGG